MNLKYLMRAFSLNVKWSSFSKIDPIRNVSHTPPSVEKSGIHFPENVLTWVLSHLVGVGTRKGIVPTLHGINASFPYTFVSFMSCI